MKFSSSITLSRFRAWGNASPEEAVTSLMIGGGLPPPLNAESLIAFEKETGIISRRSSP